MHLALIWAWVKHRLLLSPQAAAVALVLAVVALGGASLYAIGTAVRDGIRSTADARWLRATEAARAKHAEDMADANRRAAEAAERARQAAESEQQAREALSALETALAARQAHDGDPVAFPREIVKELRR